MGSLACVAHGSAETGGPRVHHGSRARAGTGTATAEPVPGTGNLPWTTWIARTQRRSPALSARAFRLLPADYPAVSAHSGRFQMNMRFDSGVLEE
jgi:hypothetical protein